MDFRLFIMLVWAASTAHANPAAVECEALGVAAEEPSDDIAVAPPPKAARPQLRLTQAPEPTSAERARAQTERDGRLLLKGVDLNQPSEATPLSKTLPSSDPGIETLREYGNYLSHGNRMFDDESSLAALAERTARGENVDLGADPGNWATHGRDHSFNIGTLGVEAVEQLRKAGYLKDVGDDVDALKVGAALLGVSHDMGMYHPEKESRDNHWKIVGKLAFGADVEKLDLQKQLLDKAIEKLSDDIDNPLVKLLYEVAESDLIKGQYSGTTKERVKVLAREFLVGNYSHGATKGEFDPILGPKHLGERRLDYMRQLVEPFNHETKGPQLEKYYRDGRWQKAFMAWADPSGTKDLPDDHPIKRLQRVFTNSESILNYADANRSRGPGMIFAAGGTQVVRYQNPDGTLSAYGVKVDPSTGKKLLVELGVRQFAGTNVTPLTLRGGAEPDFAMSVVHTKFNSEASSKTAGEQTGRVIGETTAYAYRALTDILGQGKATAELPKLKVAYPGAANDNSSFKKELEKSISASMAGVLIRNKLIPEGVLKSNGYDPKAKELPPGILSYVQNKYWEFEDSVAVDLNRPKKADPGEAVRLAQAQSAPLSDADQIRYSEMLVQSGAYGKPRQVRTSDGIIDFEPKLFLQGAGRITLKPGEKFIVGGASRGNIYLLVSGAVRGDYLTGSGHDSFEVRGDGGGVSILGATSYLTASDPGRNASLTTIGHSPVELIVIPPETARKYWRPSTLSTPASQVPAQLQMMYGNTPAVP